LLIADIFLIQIFYICPMNRKLNIVLADDDDDDHFIFSKVLKDIKLDVNLITIKDGEMLMEYLSKNIKQLPDMIFLDLNMPRKNGSECLTEIRRNKGLSTVPVIVYSTSFHMDILDLLNKYGAFYCIKKSADEVCIRRSIKTAIESISQNKHVQPSRVKFALGIEAN
jgi:CheY-like chemotaxis protein